VILPFPEWRPDLAPYLAAHGAMAQNVVPRADGYGPVKSPQALTAALPAACRGYFYARNTDGTITVFAGTSNRIFKLDNTTLGWVPVSKVTALTSISNASPAVFTKAAHALAAGDALVLSTTGSLPSGLTVGTVYYVLAAGLTADEFRVSTTPGGAAVNTSSAGSGTHSMTYFYSALPTGYHWQFAQFGSTVIAVQPNVAPQAFTLSGTAFADLGGSPPQASYVAVVGRFLVLSGLNSNPFRIQWSGLNAITTWTAGTNSSDFQDLPDGGIVRGVAGGEYGVIFQETTMRRMVYAPGSTVVFSIERIAEDKGLLAPYSIVRAGDRIFWLAAQGFHMMSPTGQPLPIGKERFDRTFFADYDSTNLQLVIGAHDPSETRVYWSYKLASSSGSTFERIIVYDYALERAALIVQSGEYLASLAAPGLTLDALDSISGSVDALTFSLDDVSNAALARLSIADTSHKLAFFSGSNLEATLDTAERALDGRRSRVRGFRPLTDAATCYGAIGARENLQGAVAYSDEQAVNGKGLCPANVSTRLARGRLRIPAGTTWSFASGVEPEFAQEGRR
jgi:hypothetical protein